MKLVSSKKHQHEAGRDISSAWLNDDVKYCLCRWGWDNKSGRSPPRPLTHSDTDRSTQRAALNYLLAQHWRERESGLVAAIGRTAATEMNAQDFPRSISHSGLLWIICHVPEEKKEKDLILARLKEKSHRTRKTRDNKEEDSLEVFKRRVWWWKSWRCAKTHRLI